MDPGSYVLTVLAADADLDPRLKYYLTGDGAEHFNLDRDTGEPGLNLYSFFEVYMISYHNFFTVYKPSMQLLFSN